MNSMRLTPDADKGVRRMLPSETALKLPHEPDPATIEPFWTFEDLRALLKVGKRTLRTWIAAKRVPAPDFRLGNLLRWKHETITVWINRKCAATDTNKTRF